MVKLLLLFFIPVMLLRGEQVVNEQAMKDKLSGRLKEIYKDISIKFPDTDKQISILRKVNPPFITELFKEQIIEAEQKDKTALMVELLEKNYSSLDKGVTTPLIAQYFKDDCNSLDDKLKRDILIELLKNYSTEERQKIITNMLNNKTNAQLLVHISKPACDDVGKKANPIYAGALPVVDWLNTAHFNGFFQPTMTQALVNRNVFNEFDSFDQWGLWIEPFGFYTKFGGEGDSLKFNQYTVGCSVGGDYTFFERLVLGLGLAYSHSGVGWQEKDVNAAINSLYFGPSLSYVFSKGFLGITIFGVANDYHVNREINIFDDIKPKQTSIDYDSWDVVARLEGGLSYPLGNQYYINPTAKVDYLNVFDKGSSEALDDEIEIKTQPLNGSFFNSKLGVKFTREFYSASTGFLIPSLSGGCLFFTPLAKGSYKYEVEGCKVFSEEQQVGAWTQYYLGAGFALVHKKGLLVSLDYEMILGADSPLYAGDLRVEWSW